MGGASEANAETKEVHSKNRQKESKKQKREEGQPFLLTFVALPALRQHPSHRRFLVQTV